MRIISKFHDYYDSAQAYGHDAERMFIRNTESVIGNVRDRLIAPLRTTRIIERRNRHLDARVMPFIVYFCGKIYPAARISFYSMSEIYKDMCCYSLEAIEGCLNGRGLSLHVDLRWRWRKSREEELKDFMAKQSQRDQEQDAVIKQLMARVGAPQANGAMQ